MHLDVFCGQEMPYIYFLTKLKINAEHQSTPKLFISVSVLFTWQAFNRKQSLSLVTRMKFLYENQRMQNTNITT